MTFLKMEDGNSRFVGPFSMLKRKSLRSSDKRRSRKLRNILGEKDNADDDDDRESVDSKCSGDVSSSQATNDVVRFANGSTEANEMECLRAGGMTNLPGNEKTYVNSDKTDESSADNVDDIEFEQKQGQGIVHEECSGMDELTKRIKGMNGTMEKDKNPADMHCHVNEGLDSAEKITEGNSEVTDFHSTVGILHASASAREERRYGKDSKVVRRKHNLFYQEAEEGGFGDRATHSNGDSTESRAHISNGGSNDSRINMSHDHNGNAPVNKDQRDGLLTRFGEHHSNRSTKKRPITSSVSDAERKMGSPISSRSSSVRSHSSSVPASIDSGLRMGFQEPHASVVVVAIDFGTTFSGYAFAFTRDPDSIHMMRKWEGGDPGVNNQKIPTTLLLKPDGSFHSFGYGARDFYHDLEHSEAKKWLYFEKFKMSLHSSEVRNQHVLHSTAVSISVCFNCCVYYTCFYFSLFRFLVYFWLLCFGHETELFGCFRENENGRAYLCDEKGRRNKRVVPGHNL